MPSVHVPVRLYRHSLDQAWGFRLQGGESGVPLNVLRVFAGGAAEGQLQRGDEVVSIDNHDVSTTSLQQAEALVARATNELLLVVSRHADQHTVHHPVVTPSASYPFDFHGGLEDYDHAQNMRQLTERFNHPHDEEHEAPVRGKVQINARPGNVSYIPKKVTIFSKPPEFGWSPKPASTHSPHPRSPIPPHQSSPHPTHHSSHHHSPLIRQVLSQADQLSSYNQVSGIEHTAYERPAWLGTLKSSNGLKPWEIQESNNILGSVSCQPIKDSHTSSMPFHPQPADDGALRAVHQPKVQLTKISPHCTTYEQHSPHHHPSSDTARVQHAQYNTPLGLYSAQNATQVLDLQTADKPGSGTLKIVSHGQPQAYSPQHSDVYKLLKEEEEERRAKRRGHNLSINQETANHHSQSFDNHQSPASAFSHYTETSLGVSDF